MAAGFPCRGLLAPSDQAPSPSPRGMWALAPHTGYTAPLARTELRPVTRNNPHLNSRGATRLLSPSQLVLKAQVSCCHPSQMLLPPTTRHSMAKAEPRLPHQGHRHLQGGRSSPLPHPQVALLFHGWLLWTLLVLP